MWKEAKAGINPLQQNVIPTLMECETHIDISASKAIHEINIQSDITTLNKEQNCLHGQEVRYIKNLFKKTIVQQILQQSFANNKTRFHSARESVVKQDPCITKEMLTHTKHIFYITLNKK